VLTTAQFAADLAHPRVHDQRVLDTTKGMLLVANHPFGGPAGVAATSARIAALGSSQALPAVLREKLGSADASLMPEVLLNLILDSYGITSVVAAMMTPMNLRFNVAAIERCRFTPLELSLLREELIRQPHR
jgi:hypothetical protein